jgi:hypothetical protein
MIHYDGRRFRPIDDGSGESARLAVYHQSGDVLWGEFSGGHAERGALAGRCEQDGTLDFAYCMVLDTAEVVAGRCRSTPELLADGRVKLHEEWERYGAHAATGQSVLEEIRQPSSPRETGQPT